MYICLNNNKITGSRRFRRPIVHCTYLVRRGRTCTFYR